MIKNIAIIGAGIAGLTTAQKLQSQDIQVDVFDKGRGVGGRMSSRRTDWGYLDHGCQYFSVTDPLFADFLEKYDRIIEPWQGVFARWQNGNFIPVVVDNFRYVPQIGMNNLCKSIAQQLNIKLQTRIMSLEKQETWTLIDEQNNQYTGYDLVIVTAPPIQTKDLLSNHTSIVHQIETIKMYPCYTLMLVLEDKVEFPFDGIEFRHPVLGWIAVNNSKPLRGKNQSLVIQSNFTWAIDNLELDRENIARQLKTNASEILDTGLDKCFYESLHLWRYAIPQQANNQGYYFDKENSIGVGGDWCLNGKVESAFLSANLLANVIIAS